LPLPEFPLAYFITFTAYGTRLPGREAGWVNRRQNRYRTPYPAANLPLEQKIKSTLRQQPFHLDSLQGPLVLAAIREA
jgi:hypothetical protein